MRDGAEGTFRQFMQIIPIGKDELLDKMMHEFDELIIKRYNEKGGWGLHVCVDLRQCNSVTIRSKDDIERFAEDLVNFIDMKRYGRPIIARFGDNDEVAGYSLVQLIETSCITGHFAEESDRAFIDIFSCKEFRPYEAARFCKSYFGAVEGQFKVLFRD